MRKILFTGAICLLLTLPVAAQLSQCTVTATLYSTTGAPLANARITVVRVIKNGAIVSGPALSYTTNASGVATMLLPRASTAYVYANAYGLDRNGTAGVPLSVPNSSTANREDLANLATVFTTLGDTLAASSNGVPVRVAGNTSTTLKLYGQIGNGTTSNLPGWFLLTGSGLSTTSDNTAKTATLSYSATSSDILTALGTQSANRVLASPNGSSGTMSVRALVSADLPSHTHALADLTQSSATTGQVAQWNGSAWAPATLNSLAIGNTVTSGTAGSLLFVGSGSVLSQNNSKLFWDNSTERLGLATTSPTAALDVRPQSSGDKGIVVRGASGQFAFLIDAQNNSGTSFFNVSGSTGAVYSAYTVTGSALQVQGTGGNGFTSFVAQSAAPGAPGSGFAMFADSAGRFSWKRASDGFVRKWDATLTADRTYTLPDVSGTVVTTGNLSAITATGTIASGTWNGSVIAPGYLGSGTPSNSNYLRGDGTWMAPAFGTMVNAASYGATGDAQKVEDAVINGTTTITSATANFVSGDVGKVVFGIYSPTGSLVVPVGTITARNSANSITVSIAATTSQTGVRLVWGTDDSNALRAAVTAAKALTPYGDVFVQRGNYLFKKLILDNLYGSPPTKGVGLKGEGMALTQFWLMPNFDFSTTSANYGAFSRSGSVPDTSFADFSVDGLGYIISGTGYYGMGIGASGLSVIQNVQGLRLRGFSGGGVLIQEMNGGFIQNLRGYGNDSRDLFFNQVSATCVKCTVSNGSGIGVDVFGVAGESNTSGDLTFIGLFADEHENSTVRVNNSTDVKFIGSRIYAGTSQKAADIQGTSVVRFESTDLVPFNVNTNTTGLNVQSGATVFIESARIEGTGTGYAINNAGTVYYIGGGNRLSGSINGTAPKFHLNLPSEASGDILVRDSTGWNRLAKGSNGTYLGVSGGAVGYYSVSGLSIGSAVGSGTANNALFVDGSGNLGQSSSFTFNSSSKLLTLKNDNIAATATDSLILSNSQASTSGTQQQFSPNLKFSANGWNSGGSANVAFDARQYLRMDATGSSVTGYWTVGLQADGAGYSDYLRVSNAGQVILGSGTPATNNTQAPLFVVYGGNGGIRLNPTANGLYSSIDISSSSTRLAQFTWGDSSGELYVDATKASGILRLQTQSTNRLSILSSGKVGIGLDTPTAQFQVAGGDMYISGGSSYGLIQKSPDGTCWRLAVSNAGALSAASITCP